MVDRWRAGWVMALLVAASLPGRIASVDAAARLELARSLWQAGTLFPAQMHAPHVVTESGPTSFYGIGQSLLLVPCDLLASVVVPVLALPPEWRPLFHAALVSSAYLMVVSLLWWRAASTLAARWGVAQGAAPAMTLLFFVAGLTWYYAAHSLQEEAVVGALVCAVYALVLAWCARPVARLALLAGLLAGVLMWFRLTAVFALLGIPGVLFDAVRRGERSGVEVVRGLAWALAGAALPLAVLLWTNWLRFGSPLATGYGLRLAMWREAGRPGEFIGPVRPAVAAALLAGPGKGLVWLAPGLGLAALGLVRVWRHRPWTWGLIVVGLVVSLLFHSKLVGFPDGSESWGPRYQVHFLGLFVYPAITGAAWLWHRRGRTWVTALWSAGVAVQLLALSAPVSLEYFQVSQARGGYGEILLMEAGHGQLAMRVRNVAARLAGRPAPWGEEGERAGAIRRMYEHYMPDVWGPVYARRLGPVAGTAVAAVWGIVLLAGAAGLIVLAKRMKKKIMKQDVVSIT